MKNDLQLLYVSVKRTSAKSNKKFLLKYFSKIHISHSNHEAIKLFNKYKPELIILDFTEKSLANLDLIYELREMNSTVEVIVLTNTIENGFLIDMINLKVFSYLLNPVDDELLEQNIQKAIEKIYLKETKNLYGGFSYNTKYSQLFYDNKRVKLTKKEQLLVDFLYDRNEKYFLACAISQAIFTNSSKDDSLCNGVVQLISRFKKKMLEFCNEEEFFIDKVYALGYKLKTI
jgi:DNA-binding response OmpR family regulator